MPFWQRRTSECIGKSSEIVFEKSIVSGMLAVSDEATVKTIRWMDIVFYEPRGFIEQSQTSAFICPGSTSAVYR